MKNQCFGLCIVLALLLNGCANTALNMNQMSVGMSKSEVISVLGEPSESRASDGVEYLMYRLRTTPSAGKQAGCGAAGWLTLGLTYMIKECQYSNNDYFVQLEENKVRSYGRVGDFDSTEDEKATITVNQTIKEVDD